MWDKKPNTITKVQNKIKGGKKLGENSAAIFLQNYFNLCNEKYKFKSTRFQDIFDINKCLKFDVFALRLNMISLNWRERI